MVAYIPDNFAAGEIDKSGSTFLSGEIIHQEAERLWTAAGVVSAAKKRKSGEITGQELGAYLNGSERTMGPSPERMINLLLGTMALLSRRTLSRKFTAGHSWKMDTCVSVSATSHEFFREYLGVY